MSPWFWMPTTTPYFLPCSTHFFNSSTIHLAASSHVWPLGSAPANTRSTGAPIRAAHSTHSLTCPTSAARCFLSGEAKLLRTPVPLTSSPSSKARRLNSLTYLSLGTLG